VGTRQDDALHAMEENLAGHLAYLPRHLGAGIVCDEAGILLVDSGLPCDTFNAVCRARLDEAGANRRIEWAVGHFRAKGFPFSWWVGPSSGPGDLEERLTSRGLRLTEVELGMTLDLSDAPEHAPPPPKLEIRRVRTAAELRAYAGVIAANWDPPDLIVMEVYERAASAALEPACPARYYLGYLDSEPVAASECFLAGGVAGIYNVVTLPRMRRRGFGTALTAAALAGAFSAGYRTAVLQASAQGQGVYARLGFVARGEFREYH
jgi:ribosomal protein S18 acetylase RimI-like enzyme